MILGPNGPFCNIPPAIETHVEFISDIIKANDSSSMTSSTAATNGAVHTHADDSKAHTSVIESTKEAENGWTDTCDKLSAGSLFRKTDSWIFGSNVPGKKVSVLFYFGGLSIYRNELRKIAEEGWKGFRIS